MKSSRGSEWDRSAYIGIRRRRDIVLRPLSAALARLRVPASAISLLGVALAATSCWAIARSLPVALLTFIAALTCDALDGAVARRQRTASAGGKAIDNACDTATFLLVLLAIARCPPSSIRQIALTALLAVPLLLGAIQARKRRSGSGLAPTGGFLAHAFKAPIYGAFLLYTAAGVNLLAPAVRLGNAMAAGSLLIVAGTLLVAPSGSAQLLSVSPGTGVKQTSRTRP